MIVDIETLANEIFIKKPENTGRSETQRRIYKKLLDALFAIEYLEDEEKLDSILKIINGGTEMTTLEELKAELAKLQGKIDEYEKQKGRSVPKSGDRVYCVTWVKPEYYFYNEDNFHDKRLAKLGLLVPTLEEYHRVVAKMKARTKLLRCEGAREGFKFGKDNCYFERSNKQFDLSLTQAFHIGAPAYFDTKAQAKAALDSMTEEDLDALFPVVRV